MLQAVYKNRLFLFFTQYFWGVFWSMQDKIYYRYLYGSGLKLNSCRATALQSLAPNHTCSEVSCNPEDLDWLDQVCLIRVGAKLCRAVALQELSLRPMLYGSDPQIWPIPAAFSSNPNQTPLSMLIRVFKIIRKSQVGEFDQGWS